jgi:hypothetical protein
VLLKVVAALKVSAAPFPKKISAEPLLVTVVTPLKVLPELELSLAPVFVIEAVPLNTLEVKTNCGELNVTLPPIVELVKAQ